MMALEEAIEALDGMLDYQNQSISERESGMDQGTSGSLSEVQIPYVDFFVTTVNELDIEGSIRLYHRPAGGSVWC